MSGSYDVYEGWARAMSNELLAKNLQIIADSASSFQYELRRAILREAAKRIS